MAGLTTTGFVIKTQPELEAEISDGLKANVSPSINTMTDSVTGQLVKLVSERLSSLWDLGQAIYNAMYPNTAEGTPLNFVSSLTGTFREDATKTRVVASVNIDPGTYAAGSLIAHVQDRPQDRFVSIEDAVNGGGSAASVDVIFEAEEAGPVSVPATLLNVIAQAVSGWNTVSNAAAHTTLGALQESDEELRIRREQELSAQGSTTAAAIASDIRRYVSGVTSVRVLHNDSDSTDSNGLPPHSIEAIVLGPVPPSPADDIALATQISLSKADGIKAYGTDSENITDSEGNVEAIGFTRPSDYDLEVEIEVVVPVAGVYAGDDEVKAALIAYIDSLEPGQDIIFNHVISAALEVAGVTDVTTANTNMGPAGGSLAKANISIDIRTKAKLVVGDITVTVV